MRSELASGSSAPMGEAGRLYKLAQAMSSKLKENRAKSLASREKLNCVLTLGQETLYSDQRDRTPHIPVFRSKIVATAEPGCFCVKTTSKNRHAPRLRPE